MLRLLVCLAFFGWCLSGQANADTVVSATGVVSAPAHTGSFSFDRTIDQSGLTAGYLSGVTDFDAYVGAGPRHHASNLPPNYAASFALGGNVDYDLGSSNTITRLAFWNYPFLSPGGVLGIDVYTSSNAAFVGATFVGSFAPINDGSGLGAPGNAVQVFDVTDTSARYVRIDVTSIAGGGFGISEVAFAASSVPEPASAILLLSGLGVCIARRRRKQQG